MITIFELKFQSSEKLRKKLGIFGSKWAEKLDIKDLLRIAFPESTDTEIKANLKYFIEHGIFRKSPVSPKAMHTNYCHEFGYSLPFDADGYVYEEPKVACIEPKVTKPMAETIDRKMKYLFVLSRFASTIRVYYIENLEQYVLNAIVELLAHNYNISSSLENELFDCIDSNNKIICDGKVLQITHEHPYALCNDDFEVE